MLCMSKPLSRTKVEISFEFPLNSKEIVADKRLRINRARPVIGKITFGSLNVSPFSPCFYLSQHRKELNLYNNILL